MTSGPSSGDRDDEALGWAGDDDPTLVTGDDGATPDGPAPRGADLTSADPSFDTEHVPEGWTVSGPTAAVVADAERRRVAAPTSSVTLIALGVFGGIYLLYTIGWFIGTSRIDNPLTDPLGRFMFSLGLWLAVAAPALWFGSTFSLTRTRPGPRARLALLLLGAVLLAPLPFIVTAGGIS